MDKIGGMKTVIWTDFILFLVIVTGARITIVSIGNDLPNFNKKNPGWINRILIGIQTA